MSAIRILATLAMGLGLMAMGFFMVRTGKSPVGIPPGQEEFQAMHATAFDALHRITGAFWLIMGLAIELIALHGLVKALF